MRVLIQKSQKSSVIVDNKVVGKIAHGLVVFSCFEENDGPKQIEYLAKKICNLRIFEDESRVMNLSLLDTQGDILSVSQFTLYADCTKGNRPSYIRALSGDKAIVLYNLFNEELKKYAHVETGVFGADMLVNIENDGPTTIILDSKE